MSITGVTQTSPSTSTQVATKTPTVGKDEFLKLFITQIKAQNPLSPMDSAQFTSQLAQFSSLEQLTSINTGLDTMIALQGSLGNSSMADLIGKQVKISDGDFQTVTSVIFDQGMTSLVLADGTTIVPGQITAIQGGK